MLSSPKILFPAGHVCCAADDKGNRDRFGNPRLRDNLVNRKNGTEYILPISLRLQADPLTRIRAIMARLHPGIFIAFHDVQT